VKEVVAEVAVGEMGEERFKELLRRLVKRGVLELKPTLDKAGVHYVEAKEAWKSNDSVQVRGLLDVLEKKRFLKSRLLERVLTCPNCGSPEVHSKYACSRCGSYDVDFVELLEHAKCGHIGTRGEFLRDAGLVCPSCRVALVEEVVDYRVIGNFYQCEKCGYRFDKPEVVHFCQNCGRVSSVQEAKYVKLSAYTIAEDLVREFARELPILETIEKVLAGMGFRVKLRAKIGGASGVQSPFDVVAEKNGVRLVMDVSVVGDKKDIVALLAKKIDVAPTKAVIVDLSGGEELVGLGRVYDITVFKAAAGGVGGLPEGFEDFLAALDLVAGQRANEKVK
jgi:predicted RNA-binding Zn-ribbon protein involved in translation (DUF1610 family)